jgi:hypothetical protein
MTAPLPRFLPLRGRVTSIYASTAGKHIALVGEVPTGIWVGVPDPTSDT